MTTIILVLFGIVFAAVIFTVIVGEKYFASQKKKIVTEMLQATSSDIVPPESTVLIEKDGGGSRAALEFLSRINVIKKVEATLQQSGLSTTLPALGIQMLVLAVVGTLIGLRFGFLFGSAFTAPFLAIAFGSVPYLFVRRARNKRIAAFEEQFPEALDFLARAMRAGHAFSIALEMLSQESPQPLGQEFRKVHNEHNLGLPIEVALTNLATRMPLIDVSFFVSAVLLQRETGGNLAEILTKLATIIRERFKLKGQVKALSAHGRITGSILTLMPIFTMVGLLIVAPGYLQSMAKDPTGKYMIAGAIFGIFLGHYFIRRIINIKV